MVYCESMNVAINGFGRIGRGAFKAGFGRAGFKVVAINDLASTDNLAYLLTHDSVYGRWDHDVKPLKDAILVDGKKIPVFTEKDPSQLPWKSLKVDVVIESTGRFSDKTALEQHVTAGAKKVVLSAPGKNGVPTYVCGVNDDEYFGERAISNASCTTNSVAPVTKVIHESFHILKAIMSTVHGYTAEQSLVDGPMPPLHKDLRRGRAAALNIVPTSTGAAIAVTETLPELTGMFDGIALRVPVPAGSLSDITFVVKKKTSVEQVNKVLIAASKTKALKGILEVSDEPLVSTDILGTTASCIVDLSMTKVVGGDLVKVLAWYDNEAGYSHRLVDMVLKVGGKK